MAKKCPLTMGEFVLMSFSPFPLKEFVFLIHTSVCMCMCVYLFLFFTKRNACLSYFFYLHRRKCIFEQFLKQTQLYTNTIVFNVCIVFIVFCSPRQFWITTVKRMKMNENSEPGKVLTPEDTRTFQKIPVRLAFSHLLLDDILLLKYCTDFFLSYKTLIYFNVPTRTPLSFLSICFLFSLFFIFFCRVFPGVCIPNDSCSGIKRNASAGCSP